ncbi:hypothetical protein BJ742DRAFT_856577 [Cladochytrium replicatum]|nr:hypothetical protein BJ742DRAFT_856577 [Cladochytrium replicatum]
MTTTWETRYDRLQYAQYLQTTIFVTQAPLTVQITESVQAGVGSATLLLIRPSDFDRFRANNASGIQSAAASHVVPTSGAFTTTETFTNLQATPHVLAVYCGGPTSVDCADVRIAATWAFAQPIGSGGAPGPQQSSTPTDGSGGLGTGGIVGIAIGGLVAALIVGLGVYILIRRRQVQKKKQQLLLQQQLQNNFSMMPPPVFPPIPGTPLSLDSYGSYVLPPGSDGSQTLHPPGSGQFLTLPVMYITPQAPSSNAGDGSQNGSMSRGIDNVSNHSGPLAGSAEQPQHVVGSPTLGSPVLQILPFIGAAMITPEGNTMLAVPGSPTSPTAAASRISSDGTPLLNSRGPTPENRD